MGETEKPSDLCIIRFSDLDDVFGLHEGEANKNMITCTGLTLFFISQGTSVGRRTITTCHFFQGGTQRVAQVEPIELKCYWKLL